MTPTPTITRVKNAIEVFGGRLSQAWYTLTAQQKKDPGSFVVSEAYPSDIIPSITLDHAKNIVFSHSLGDFSESSAFVDLLLTDVDVSQALQQRINQLLSLELELFPGDDSARAKRVVDDVGKQWSKMYPRAVLASMLRSSIMLGFWIGQNVYTWNEEKQEFRLQLKSFNTTGVWHEPVSDRWYTSTKNTGTVEIVPGDGQWVLYAPQSQERPYLYGAIRCIPVWFISAVLSLRDANRKSETLGQGVWKVQVPHGQLKSPEGIAFQMAVQRMGRNPVIPTSVGPDGRTSYDVNLLEGKSDGWQMFDFLMKYSAQKIRLAILQQDLTSRSGTEGGTAAQSETGLTVSSWVTGSDSQTSGECLRDQSLSHWVVYKYGKEELTPYSCWEVNKEAKSAKVTALNTGADAVTKWVDIIDKTQSEDEVDAVAFAKECGLPLKKRVKNG